MEVVTAAGGGMRGGAWRNVDPSVQYRPPRCCLHQAIGSFSSFLQGQLSECEKYFPSTRENSELGHQHGSGQILSTQPGFRALHCFVQPRTSLALLLQCFPHQGASVGPEGSRVHSAWNYRQSPPPTAWLIATPAWPLRTHLFPAQPASLHFSSSPLGLLHFLPAQRLSSFPVPHPSALLPTYRPQTLALAPQPPRGLALSKSVWGPA